jgi:hypothetical protein
MVAAATAGIAVGLVIGLALGGDDEQDPLQGVRDARASLRRASGVLEVVPVEYAEGVKNGRVASAPEYQGARRAIGRSRDLYREARPVVSYIDAERATDLDHSYERLARAVAARTPENDMKSQALQLEAALEQALGADRP